MQGCQIAKWQRLRGLHCTDVCYSQAVSAHSISNQLRTSGYSCGISICKCTFSADLCADIEGKSTGSTKVVSLHAITAM